MKKGENSLQNKLSDAIKVQYPMLNTFVIPFDETK